MNDNHDDGLVHSHNYACSERGRMAHQPMTTRPEEYDEGLVHSHNYACGERGQPAHR